MSLYNTKFQETIKWIKVELKANSAHPLYSKEHDQRQFYMSQNFPKLNVAAFTFLETFYMAWLELSI